MDPNQASGNDRENEKGERKEKDKGIKRRNRLFIRYLERRKTDTIVDDDASKGDINIGTLVRRTQSDKTEYSAKLKEKMSPHDLSSPTSPAMDPEEIRHRRMIKRSKVIEELVRTEGDYQKDLELCIREVLLPLRAAQVVDVDRLFTNIESVHDVSAELLHRLQEAIADPDPEKQHIGEVFIQVKAVVEEVYKIYCYHHDEANALLKSYEGQEDIQMHFRRCISALKQIYDLEGKPNLLDMGSLIIKPVQRVMKYPLLLAELWNATPTNHPDNRPLQEALTTVKIINININEFKRRKDIVLKYKRSDDETSLMGKLNKFSIHSIRKKSDRLTSYFKILTGVEPQVRDEAFDKEEKLFRSLEKAVRQLVKNISCYLLYAQEMISIAVQNAQDLEAIMKDPDKIDTNGYQQKRNGNDPYKQFKDRIEHLVLAPLSALLGMFTSPQKLIQKRYDKLLDYCSQLDSRSSKEEQGLVQKDYQALNAQLLEELRFFNQAVRKILTNCLIFIVKLIRELMDGARPPVHQLPVPLSNFNEVQNSIMEELSNLAFVKENSQKLMERKVSFEKRDKKMPPEIPRQTEEHRVRLLEEYAVDRLYQLKRNCNACQEQDISLLEGELVARLEDRDPTGSNSRWLVDTGSTQGYVYASFLKPYNPQREVTERPDDFDNLSLFVSGSRSSSTRSFSPYCTSDSMSPLSEPQDEQDTAEEQHFYAVYAFQARCDQELTLQEYQPVRILEFSDLSGNKDWWLAEANGQKGYIPANYLGKMSYA
ncbi:rho guanine nucleotide exchange factor 38 isoform X1 [Xyrauchen texanus]|uniref:rho guanine nucleotide exchange factor 38 isoform X1 n=2 Tax=Xyrauchen texanus TaxID=154827 RepID=UPI002241B45E|nr:rho guanine nucleotide exchange factor 38 isoform X1 [Xyrauchen texanus]XP_051993245.1 rho guanine nucleotide exchange factor 38 isoform X1 [Xyrauchen texanus]XP_051993246.1 rho guanine nucleotide exchange factor 38 isoform X1 [Xyrauchen texanus]